MRPKQQSIDVRVSQGALNYARDSRPPSTLPFFATVTKVYPERLTCDLVSLDGSNLTNVPILSRAGLVSGAPYGDFWMPAIDDVVLLLHAGNGEQLLVIVGTVIPYLVNAYNADAVNSASKQFTKKLIEKDTALHYKKIFKSGTTVEVEEDGTIVVEVPSGTYIRLDEAASTVTIEDQHGNTVSMESGKVVINGNLEVLQ